MNYSSKIKIAAVVGLVITVIIFIFMVIFVENNSEKKSKPVKKLSNTSIKDDNKKIIDFEKVSSLCIEKRNNKKYLVSILNDFKTEDIIELDNNFVAYDYSGLKIYLLYEETGKFNVYEFDGKEKKMLSSIGTNYSNSFEVLENNIYWAEEASIYRMDILNFERQKIVELNDGEIIKNIKLDKENNIMYFMKNILEENRYKTSICKIDLKDFSQNEVLMADLEGKEIFFEDKYIVCDVISDNSIISYLFNIENETFWELGEGKENIKEKIVFSKDNIFFLNGYKIIVIDYNGNILNEDLLNFQEETLDISIINNDYMQIIIDSEPKKSFVLNLKDGTINEMNNIYYSILNIK